MSDYPAGWNDAWNDLPEDMRRFALHVGPTDASVLLLGPPGSGKGYLARILHELSPRAKGPLVSHNCGVFTEGLAEARLFGHVRGAFTGATESRTGLVEAAAGGTLFLDEFGALPRAVQAMFLMFLETGEFSRLGSTRVRKASTRVVAATNRDLGAAIAAGEFREDLVARLSPYYRVPPLRERRTEIAGIMERFLRTKGVQWEITDDARARLCGHDWPGNIRQLHHVMRYCVYFAQNGRIGLDLVEEAIRNQQIIGGWSSRNPSGPAQRRSDEAVKRELTQALEAAAGVKSEAARMIGVHRTTVYRRMKKYGVTV